MLFNIIMWISLLIIFIVSMHNFYLGLKYRNIKYTYRIKNKIQILLTEYENIKNTKLLDKYPYFNKFIEANILKILNIKEISNVKDLKVSIKKKSEVYENEMHKINHELYEIFNEEKELINLIFSWVDCEKTILKIKKPFWYFVNFNVKINCKVLKKMIEDKILLSFEKTLKTLTFDIENTDNIFLSYNKLYNKNIILSK